MLVTKSAWRREGGNFTLAIVPPVHVLVYTYRIAARIISWGPVFRECQTSKFYFCRWNIQASLHARSQFYGFNFACWHLTAKTTKILNPTKISRYMYVYLLTWQCDVGCWHVLWYGKKSPSNLLLYLILLYYLWLSVGCSWQLELIHSLAWKFIQGLFERGNYNNYFLTPAHACGN